VREHREQTDTPCLVFDVNDVQMVKEVFRFCSDHGAEVVVDISARSFTVQNILGEDYVFSDQMDDVGAESFQTVLSICREELPADRIFYSASVAQGDNC